MATYETEIVVRLETDENIPTFDFNLKIFMCGNMVLELKPEDGAIHFTGLLPDSKEGSYGIISWDEKFVKIFLDKSGDGNGHEAILKFPFNESFRSVMKLWKALYNLNRHNNSQE